MKNIDNNSSFSQIAEMKSEQEQQINDLVNQLIDRISKCNPLQLLKYCQGMSLKTMVNVPNEEQSQSLESMATQRAVEYVQSILVAYKGDRKEKEGDPSSLFFEISKIVEQIYEKTLYFYLAIGAENKLQNDLDEDLQKDIIEEQLMYSVRGNRFQVMEEEYYRELLSLHSDEFRKLFNIDTTAVVEGIVKLQHSLTQGVCDVINQLGDQIEAISLDDINQISEPTKSSLMSLFQQVLGFDLNDVCKVTGWPETFVKPLSYEIGEAESFLSEKEYAGWPIIDMPIQKRPFIVIDGKYYCFDYYSFADNFYRAIQKQISRLDTNYNWSAVQKEASENFVTQVFQKLLPGSVAYVNNYYPQNESLKSHYENDLIIQYYDTLIIVEVKAGSFVYTAPLFDYKAHIASYKALIEKPSLQCKRAYDYLHKSNCPVLYDEKGNKKAVLNMDSIADVFMFSVSIDNINATAAKAEKISFLNINDPVICIAIDDLLVYQKYFDSPLQFLHFLQQRRRATLSKNLFMNDELDHLGLYISKNCYTQSESNTESFDQVIPIGFTNDIDNYFDQLYHPELSPDKPKQIMPPFFEKALRYLDSCNQKDKTRISTYLLDLSFKAREEFSRHIETVIARQKASRKQMAITMSSKNVNGIRCTCFINQEGVDSLSLKEQEEYTMSTLLGNDEEKRILLAFDCDENDSVTCVEYKVITKNDIPRHKIAELLAAREHVMKNVIPEKDNRSVKVGRNDRCPCGSGKKYKQCCGRTQ